MNNTNRYLISIKKECQTALQNLDLSVKPVARVHKNNFPELSLNNLIHGGDGHYSYVSIEEWSDGDAMMYKMKYAELGYIFEEIVSVR